MANDYINIYGYKVIVLILLFFIFTIQWFKNIIKNRKKLTVIGNLLKNMGIGLFWGGGLIIILNICNILSNGIFMFFSGISIGLSALVIGYVKKNKIRFSKEWGGQCDEVFNKNVPYQYCVIVGISVIILCSFFLLALS